MELALYTHSVSNLPFDAALDLAVGIGTSAIELAVGDHLSAPRMRILELLENPTELRAFKDKITSRGLRLAAVNSLGWPVQPEFEKHIEAVKGAIRLAHELGVDKLVTVSGCLGEPPTMRAMNWLPFPAPADYGEIPVDYNKTLDEQWNRTADAWSELTDYAVVHGIRKIALSPHPLQLVYNVPTLLRFRGQVSSVIGANVDPANMFWQQMDPIRAIHALGPAVHHVHLNDVGIHRAQLELGGVFPNTTVYEEPRQRAWTYRVLGEGGHDADYWRAFLQALREVGYDDILTIAQKDPFYLKEVGVIRAAQFVLGLLAVEPLKVPS
jgi:sugar phosphate isomerase/epimerase